MHTTPEHAALRRLLLERAASFAVGVPGIMAEFHWVGDEPIAHDDGALAVATSRGAVRIDPCGAVRAEAAVPEQHGAGARAQIWWLPHAQAQLPAEGGLRELGRDDAAVRPRDRGALLFDLGFASGHVRACVRSDDPRLIDVLRAHAGDDLLQPGHPAMAAIKTAGPHRVFHTRMTRIEVYQPIPSRARRERTPDGPHTHVLPAFLGRPDPFTAGLPPGSCAVLAVFGAAA